MPERITDPWITDPVAQRVMGMLTGAGHQAYFVGGCVRNALLVRPVTDIDITTSAHPETVSDLAERAGFSPVPTGIEHGTVTVVAEGTPFEITTFRRDVETDGRRAVVAYANTVEEDARRRDFTMNALYADADGAVTDPVGGLPDLHAGRLRFIGSAEERIREDALRILRFFRFHAWYGDPDGGLDADGLAACSATVDLLGGLSRERIGQEMRKLLAAPDPAPALAAFGATGGLIRVLPGANPALLAVLVHVEQGAGLAPHWLRRLAMIGPPDDTAERLRLSRTEGRTLAALLDAVRSDAGAAELGYRHGVETALSALAIRAAPEARELSETEYVAARTGARQVFPLAAADLPDDLEGPDIGAALKAAERRWIDSGFRLTKADLLR